jgi:tetratricopeptide (TPR) repeat protein
MIAGIEAMNRGELETALGYFGAAAELRLKLPWEGDPESAWLLAAAWINRGDVLQQRGGVTDVPDAVASYDLAIHAMRYVPRGASPVIIERLILAWIDKGTACGRLARSEESLAAFDQAEGLLSEEDVEVTPQRRFLAMMLRVNRARFLLDQGAAIEGWKDARVALALLSPLRKSGPVPEAEIKARSIHCRALAMLLDEPGGVELVEDWIAEATDSVEEALALVRRSGYSDEWVPDLVRYGAKIYLACQPQFLGEFLTEWLAGDGPLAADAELRGEMKNVLLIAQLEVERKVLLLPQDTEFVEKQMRILKSLQRAVVCL